MRDNGNKNGNDYNGVVQGLGLGLHLRLEAQAHNMGPQVFQGDSRDPLRVHIGYKVVTY